MKNRFMSLLLCLAIVFPLTACGSGITQEQYDGLQREIAETEAKLKSLEEQYLPE